MRAQGEAGVCSGNSRRWAADGQLGSLTLTAPSSSLPAPHPTSPFSLEPHFLKKTLGMSESSQGTRDVVKGAGLGWSCLLASDPKAGSGREQRERAGVPSTSR